MKKIILILLILAVTGLSGCLEVGAITPSMSSNVPFQVSEGETVTFTGSISNSPIAGATVKVLYVDPNQLLVTDTVFLASMTTVGITDVTGKIQYTIPTGVKGKRLVYAIDKPSAFISPGFGLAYVI